MEYVVACWLKKNKERTLIKMLAVAPPSPVTVED
jgi:hypothetical protein